MTRFLLFLAIAAALIWALLAGPFAVPLQVALAPLGRWLLAQQAAFQTGLAQSLRGVHAGQGAAFWGLMGMCLAYGFVHAAGPGHGKALLAAYGVARRVPLIKLAGIGFLSAMAQGTAAVLLVLVLAGMAGMGRSGIETVDRGFLNTLSLGAMGAVGLWLVWRALTRLARATQRPSMAPIPAAATARVPGRGPASALLAANEAGDKPGAYVYSHHAPGEDDICPDCGGSHLPPPEAMLRAASWREVAALVAAVAVRPCSGALVLLLLTWQMGLLWVGIAGTYAMALGTAGVAATLALALALGRDGLLHGTRGMNRARQMWLAGGIEALAGLALVVGVLSVALAMR
ncbi:MAG: hypothetical protein JJU15_12950 [Pararhodobacter sp.]|nr:hypothetical protein [Pararhodobacter sp.]